jgi:hypothetical protein
MDNIGGDPDSSKRQKKMKCNVTGKAMEESLILKEDKRAVNGDKQDFQVDKKL